MVESLYQKWPVYRTDWRRWIHSRRQENFIQNKQKQAIFYRSTTFTYSWYIRKTSDYIQRWNSAEILQDEQRAKTINHLIKSIPKQLQNLKNHQTAEAMARIGNFRPRSTRNCILRIKSVVKTRPAVSNTKPSLDTKSWANIIPGRSSEQGT